ncbi:MAG: glycerate kinase [Microthrixaceae bacterium]
MRVLVAPDKFRGTASAPQVAAAIAEGLTGAGHRATSQPLSDGGEGFLEVLGGANRSTTVTGPLGDEVEAGWRLASRTAVIEMALASGLSVVGGADSNDPVAASTYGTGELISAALDAGARKILLGVGGSASTDGGLGALRALEPMHRLRGVDLQIACDVRLNVLEAARVFSPQKGATSAQVQLLEGRLARLAQMYADDYGTDVVDLEGGGAGGGLAGGLACVGGMLSSGFDLVSEAVDLDELIESADLVITGEGFLDEESFHGKLVGGVVEMCQSMDTPVVAVVGQSFDDAERRVPTVSLVESFGWDAAMGDTIACLIAAAPRAVGLIGSPGD